MSLMLGQARGQAGDALAELRHLSHPSGQGLCCGGMGDLFVVQGGFGALELGAQRGRLLLQAFQCLRSEEHTSELQSLMRTSYAVFCLKKKITQEHKKTL